jgi:hypothetical protein
LLFKLQILRLDPYCFKISRLAKNVPHIEPYHWVRQSIHSFNRNNRKALPQAFLEQGTGLQFLAVFDARRNGDESYSVPSFHELSLLRQRLPRRRVVSGAALHFVTFFGFDFQLAIAAIELGISRRVAQVVLAAQFGGDLVEGLP